MNLLPKTSENFSQKEYWESFFKKRGSKAFEWYGEYQELIEIIHSYIKKSNKILMVGCGNSTLSMDMYDQGFSSITNIDISTTVIKNMQKINQQKRPLMEYSVMDALNTTFESQKFDIVFDKGTLDALVSDNSQESLNRAEKLFNEATRLTKSEGKYICISLLQEHILNKLISYFSNSTWYITVQRCLDAEKKSVERGETGVPVFAIICTKFIEKSKKKSLYELNVDGNVQSLKSAGDLKAEILSMQQAVFALNGLKNLGVSNDEEIVFELFENSKVAAPRFTIHVVESKSSKKPTYAAFVVPLGRELEWLFATREGRQKILKSANCSRLAIVSMHREHKYIDLEKIKEELNEHIMNLAPADYRQKIDFLSLGTDLGERDLKFKGNSEVSGQFIIENVKKSEDEIYRQLIFLNSQNIVQSEAKLKAVKKKGKKKFVVDPSYIACEHHIYMGLGSYLVEENNPKILVVGLGGGGLCTFITQYIPGAKITAIDIDSAMVEVATNWFGLELNEYMEVKIEDGLKCLENEADNGSSFNAILFDVDNKDTKLGMSCPPKEFLEPTVLENVKKLIGNQGIFILNLVLRDEKLRPNICKSLKSKFQSVLSYKLEEDLNEIFYCKFEQKKKKIFEEKLKDAITNFNNLCKNSKIQNDELDFQEINTKIKIE